MYPAKNKHKNSKQKGQAIIMVTIALVALCGLLGLAVDLGWGYYVKRSAQSAADAAALAAARRMLDLGGIGFPCYNSSCRTAAAPFVCTPGMALDVNDNLTNGCLYARQNGFEQSGRRTVSIFEDSASGTGSPTIVPPTAPGVEAYYYVTVRVAETIPQLFSAILGNTEGIASARATAAIVESQMLGSLILLNREDDIPNWGGGGSPRGINLDGQGTVTVEASGGALLASGCNGGGNCSGNYSGELGGNAIVRAPFTHIRGAGGISAPAGSWTAPPVSGKPEGGSFQDPTRGKPQIPLTGAAQAMCPIPGGVINAGSGTIVLGPGNYYATAQQGGVTIGAREPIRFVGDVRFGSGGSCMAGSQNAGAFGDYFFYGGVEIRQDAQLTFDPGRYVIAGAYPLQNGSAGNGFDLSNGRITLQSSGSGSSYAGEVFIFTDARSDGYPGLRTQLDAMGASAAPGATDYWARLVPELRQPKSGFKTGNQPVDHINISLDGLNKNGTGLPSELHRYPSSALWQDRRNSTVRYDPNGNIACGNPAINCTKNATQLAADGVLSDSPELYFRASPSARLRGNIYQPRGAWTVLQGGGNYNSPLQIVTGALSLGGNGTLILQPLTTGAITQTVVGLVE